MAYKASTAQWYAQRSSARPKESKLACNERLRQYVQDRLSGAIARPDGSIAAGPTVRWKGRRHGRRADRRWARAWSPEQIANRCKIDFPDDPSMRISHEAIYQALFIHGRGGLSRELTACLRTGRALRVPRARRRRAGRHFITEEVKIGNRPVEVDDREQAGHWEGDLIIGLDKSAIGTLVERTTRYTMLLHLPRMEEFATAQRFKNGPPVAGHGAQAVRQAITAAMQRWPVHLRRTLTWDQGAEMAQHAELTLESGMKVFFCDPRSPWQRGTDENTNGVLRQYFPKGTDLCRHPIDDLEAVAAALNDRPRKILGWRTPAEAMSTPLSQQNSSSVATTP